MRKLILVLFTMSFLVACSTKNGDELELLIEDFKWGSSIEEVKELIISKGHYPVQTSGGNVGYIDVILSEEVLVAFYFTPKTRKLYKAALNWNTDRIRDRLQKILDQKYGTSGRESEDVKEYQQEDYRLILELGSSDTLLGLYSNEYTDIHKQEEERRI